MSDEVRQISYLKLRDIFDRHGLIVFLLYCATEIISWLTYSHWLRALPRKLYFFRSAFDTSSKTVKPWWQDIVFLFSFLLLTPTALLMAWNSNTILAVLGTAFSGYILLDLFIYLLRVLWFDDLRPGIPDFNRGVASHRRILFVAILSFAQSILLFTPLYRCVPELYNLDFAILLRRSFSTATLLSFDPKFTVVDVIQVLVSLVFIVIAIATMASISYRRSEFRSRTD